VRPVRLAVADDSTFVRMAVARMLRDEPRIEVVGLAASGEELLTRFDQWQPDVITLDLAMPGIGGLGTLDHIRARSDVPVIILSTHAGRGAPQTLEALHRGATDFVDKQQYSLIDFRSLREVLIERILAVVGTGPASVPVRARPLEAEPRRTEVGLVLVGASTGGPPAIERLLADLGDQLPVPLVVAQHMPEGFTRAFADRLNARLPLEVREASHGEVLRNGQVLVAPAGLHLRIVTRRGDGLPIVELGAEPRQAPNHPSVDELFRSAATVFGARAVAVLLTGMGRDGAAGLEELATRGGLALIQDRASSVVWGMPGAAVGLGFPHEQLPLDRIGPRLRQLWESPASEDQTADG
jgi:two-component system, chemotaxis family, protein-glutamate methylesterase/glutaminase